MPKNAEVSIHFLFVFTWSGVSRFDWLNKTSYGNLKNYDKYFLIEGNLFMT